jgi:hypothetical protein
MQISYNRSKIDGFVIDRNDYVKILGALKFIEENYKPNIDFDALLKKDTTIIWKT